MSSYQSPQKTPAQRLVDTPLKIAVVSCIVSLIITLPLVQYFRGEISSFVPIIVIACAFPCAYFTSRLALGYQRTIAKQNIQLQHLTDEIRRTNLLLHKQNGELTQLADDLKSKNEELQAFARTVAHDLKNPLTVMMTYSDLLARRLDELPPERLSEMALRAQQSGQKAVHIIDSLLLLARVGQSGELRREPLAMADIVEEAQTRLSYMFEELDATITVPPEWPAAQGYAPWIEEVWSNYLSNALKYGGRPPQVEVGADYEANGMVRFWVTDNGKGVDEADKDVVFTEFTRRDVRGIEGHGLGLSICKRIVERLGGEIGIESIESGSKFYFTLPGVDKA
ncbi:HAMP domain-containing histidine kinase [Chloroflexi bacterium TSY]|nr:HAMP domain-containing histidine kinase [Chloroflexi bacterium TSY]